MSATGVPDPPAGAREDLPPAAIALRRELAGQFSLAFVQALLKTGYYAPDHPGAREASVGLYPLFQDLLGADQEVTYLVREGREQEEIYLDGIFEEPQSLQTFMLPGMAAIFIPRFLLFFRRKGLMSFTLKKRLSEPEFLGFVEVLSESPLDEKLAQTDQRDRLALALVRKNILQVSTIFGVDVVGRERKLPWRVEVALTRLRKDLAALPLYRSLGPERLLEVKHQVFEDILRPLTTPTMLKEVLVNADLIAADIPFLQGISIEEEILSHFTAALAGGAGKEIADELEKLTPLLKEHRDVGPRHQRLETMVNLLLLRLVHARSPAGDEALIKIFRLGLAPLDLLPGDLQEEILANLEAEGLLADEEGFFAGLKPDRLDGARLARLGRAVGVLLLEKKLREACRLHDTLLAHTGTQSLEERRSSLRRHWEFVRIGKALAPLLDTQDKEQGALTFRALALCETQAAPALLDLVTHQRMWVRRTAVERLVRIGRPVLATLLERLDFGAADWYYARNALMTLGRLGLTTREAQTAVRTGLAHRQPQVREEAAEALPALFGAKAEGMLCELLGDPKAVVRLRSVKALGTLPQLGGATVERLIALLKKHSTGGREEDELVQVQACRTLRGAFAHPDVEPTLVAAVSLEKSAWLGLKKPLYRNKPEAVRIAAAAALGASGSAAALAVLSAAAAERESPLLQQAAAAALARIENRNARPR